MVDKSSERTNILSSISYKDESDEMVSKSAKSDAGGGGANVTPSEITVLERRVLAHERILQALIGHLADDDAEILVQLKARFGCEHNLGEYEQDYVSTDHYGDHFIRSIEVELDRRRERR